MFTMQFTKTHRFQLSVKPRMGNRETERGECGEWGGNAGNLGGNARHMGNGVGMWEI